jgi:MFS family permease
MIQRLQTLFLFFAFIAIVLIFFFPLASYFSSENYVKFFLLEVKSLVPGSQLPYGKLFTLPFIIMVLAILVFDFLSIMYYKKRLMQIRFVNFSILLNIVLIVLMFFYTDKISKDFKVLAKYEFGSVFPLISLVLLVLSNRFIRRDERLVRSVERLR